MKTVLGLLYFTMLICLFLDCNKEKYSYNVYVYSNKKDTYTNLKLVLNDKEKGDIPYFTQKLSFDNDSLLARALKIHLVPDNYPLIVKDQYGNVKIDGHLKAKRKSFTTDAVIGELITTTKEHDIIIEIKYN